MSFGMRGINNNLPNQNDRSNHAPRRLSFYADQNQHEIIDNDDYYQADTFGETNKNDAYNIGNNNRHVPMTNTMYNADVNNEDQSMPASNTNHGSEEFPLPNWEQQHNEDNFLNYEDEEQTLSETFGMFKPSKSIKKIAKEPIKESKCPVVFALVSSTPRSGKFNPVKVLLDPGSSGSLIISDKVLPGSKLLSNSKSSWNTLAGQTNTYSTCNTFIHIPELQKNM